MQGCTHVMSKTHREKTLPSLECRGAIRGLELILLVVLSTAGVIAASAALAEESPRPEAFTFGGVRLDADTIAVTDGEVRRGEPLVRAKGRRRAVATATATALVKAPLDLGTRERVESGTILHEVEYFDRNRDGAWIRTAFWCGPFTADTLRGRRQSTQCVQDGGVFAADPATPWLVTAPRLTFIGDVRIDLPLQPTDPDPLGPFDVEIRVDRVRRSDITLAAVAVRSGEQVVFWKGREPLSPSGEARFPFWTRSLVVRATGGGVSARLEDAEANYGFHAVRQIEPPQSIRW